MRTDELSKEPGYEYRNLVCVLRYALREADACGGYAQEAAGDDRLVEFFRETQKMNAEIAERARELLESSGDGLRFAGVRFEPAPAEGDPGDLSPGQYVA